MINSLHSGPSYVVGAFLLSAVAASVAPALAAQQPVRDPAPVVAAAPWQAVPQQGLLADDPWV